MSYKPIVHAICAVFMFMGKKRMTVPSLIGHNLVPRPYFYIKVPGGKIGNEVIMILPR